MYKEHKQKSTRDNVWDANTVQHSWSDMKTSTCSDGKNNDIEIRANTSNGNRLVGLDQSTLYCSLFELYADYKQDVPDDDSLEPLLQPDEVLAMLEKAPSIRKFVSNLAKQGKTVGTFTVHEKAEFKQLFTNYLIGKKVSSKADLPIDSAKAEEYYEEVKPEAFNDNGKIRFDKENSNKSTYIHESIHSFENLDFSKNFPLFFVEGVTEYLTAKVCDECKVEYKLCYSKELEFTKKLVAVVGESVIKKAYFNGEVAALERSIKNNLGKRCTYEDWLALIDRQQYILAQGLLVPERSSESSPDPFMTPFDPVRAPSK